MSRGKLLGFSIGLLSIIVLSACARVPSGHRGVKWTITAGTQTEVLAEGLHMLMPWNKLYIYNIRTMDVKEDLVILANNGLTINLEASIRFRPQVKDLYKLQTEIGPKYYSVILGPTVRATARSVGGRYSPEEIYSTKRDEMAADLASELQAALVGKFITLETVLIRNVELPLKLQVAISDKLEEEQRALKMKFTPAKEKREAERKKIEAKGISDFQRIVSTGLTPMLLKWKGIETTEKLAMSPNAKIIVVGSKATGGLPLIMDTTN